MLSINLSCGNSPWPFNNPRSSQTVGIERELHVEASLESTDFEDFEPETLKPTGANQILAESEVFKIKKVSVLSGELEATDTSRIPVSANALLPASEPFTFTAVTDSKFLVTEDFA